jgi:multidrug efflux pump subunit AcrA (membrane-fusion protein)
MISRQNLTLPTVLISLLLLSDPARAGTGVEVAVLEVGTRGVSAGYEIDGVIEPLRQSVVSAQVSGRVVKLLVKMGDQVKAGQVLAIIDDRETAMGVQRSAAQLSQSEAELRNAQISYERTRNLQSQGF